MYTRALPKMRAKFATQSSADRLCFSASAFFTIKNDKVCQWYEGEEGDIFSYGGVRAAGSGIGKVCVHAGSSFRGEDSAGLGYGEDVSLLGVAGSGGDDAVRLAGGEGSVSLAWRTGEG